MDLEGGAEAGTGAGQTCERVSSSVAEVVHSTQHLLLGAKGIQVPLGLGSSTVLSQAWKGRVPTLLSYTGRGGVSTILNQAGSWGGWAHSRWAGHTQPCQGHQEGMFAKPHFPHKFPLGASCLPSAGGDLSFAWLGENLALIPPSLRTSFSKLGVRSRIVRTTPAGHRAGLGPTYLDFAWPDFKGLDDAGQEVFDLLEVTVAYTPGPIHQEDHVCRRGGSAAELGSACGGRGGRWGVGQGHHCYRTLNCLWLGSSAQDLLPWGW